MTVAIGRPKREAQIKASLVTPTKELADLLNEDDTVGWWCAPENWEAIKDYALKVMSSHPTRNGVQWEARLYKSGVHVLDVEDEGNGGCLRFHQPRTDSSPSEWRKRETEFMEASQLAYPQDSGETYAKAIMFLDIIGSQMKAAK